MLTDERIYRLWADACNSPVDPTIETFARAVEAEAVAQERERFAAWLETLAGEVRAIKEKP